MNWWKNVWIFSSHLSEHVTRWLWSWKSSNCSNCKSWICWIIRKGISISYARNSKGIFLMRRIKTSSRKALTMYTLLWEESIPTLISIRSFSSLSKKLLHNAEKRYINYRSMHLLYLSSKKKINKFVLS